jgi:hypothetical protein
MIVRRLAVSNARNEARWLTLAGSLLVSDRPVLVAAALPACDAAAVVPFNGGGLVVAVLSWADGDTTWTNADCGIRVISPTVPMVAVVAIVTVIAVPPDLNIDALGHLDALSLGGSDERGSCQHRCGCRHGKSDFHHG